MIYIRVVSTQTIDDDIDKNNLVYIPILFHYLWNRVSISGWENMRNKWYIGEGYNGGLTTLEACVILAVTIYIIIEVMKWIEYLM